MGDAVSVTAFCQIFSTPMGLSILPPERIIRVDAEISSRGDGGGDMEGAVRPLTGWPDSRVVGDAGLLQDCKSCREGESEGLGKLAASTGTPIARPEELF